VLYLTLAWERCPPLYNALAPVGRDDGTASTRAQVGATGSSFEVVRSKEVCYHGAALRVHVVMEALLVGCADANETP